MSKFEIVVFCRENKKGAYYLTSENLLSSDIKGDLDILVHDAQNAKVDVQQIIKKNVHQMFNLLHGN